MPAFDMLFSTMAAPLSLFHAKHAAFRCHFAFDFIRRDAKTRLNSVRKIQRHVTSGVCVKRRARSVSGISAPPM